MIAAKAGADWPDHVKQDFERNAFNGCVGDTLLSETDKVRVWKITLKPGERIGRCAVQHYSAALLAVLRPALTTGMTFSAISTIERRARSRSAQSLPA